MPDLAEAWVSERLRRWVDARDAEALGELLKWQRDRAYTLAFQVLHNRDDAEDAVQQAFLKLLSRTHGFGGADEFRVAVYRAVVQCAVDQSRARRSRTKAENVMPFVASSDTQTSSAENAEVLALVGEELKRLPEIERAAIVLCCQEGMSLSAAAEALSIPRMTLRDRLARATADVRSRVKSRGVALSLLLLIDLLRKQPVFAASARLCRALDTKIPGAACETIDADKSAESSGGEAVRLADELNSLPALRPMLVTGAAVLVIGIALSAWKFYDIDPGTPAPTQGQGPRPTVSAAANETRPVAPAVAITNKTNGKVEDTDVNKLTKAAASGVLAAAIVAGAASRAEEKAPNAGSDSAQSLENSKKALESARIAQAGVVTVGGDFEKIGLKLLPKAVWGILQKDPKSTVKIEGAEKAPGMAEGTSVYKINGNEKQLFFVDDKGNATVNDNVTKIVVGKPSANQLGGAADPNADGLKRPKP